jgi:two-component system sensor histidine kinase BaeS
MRSLYWKGMLAFLSVILVAVGTMAFFIGRFTENQFRRYTLVQEGMWNQQVSRLAAYYADHGSWEGIQDVLMTLPRMQRGRERNEQTTGHPPVHLRLTDAKGRIVADTDRPPDGRVFRAELENSIPIEIDGQVVGYLLPSVARPAALQLTQAQLAFLNSIRQTLWIAALVALVAATIIGGFLFLSITTPLHRLTSASQAIAEGDLSARAPVRGQDEVAQLAVSFNQMAESLAQAEEARQHQTADIAHELRTPLTVLQGTLEAMLDGVYSTDQENLRAALTQTRTLSRLVDDLRLLALADAGQLHLQKRTLDLGTLLQEIAEAHQPQARDQKVALAFETPPASLLILADQDRLAQVMGNLLSNALRYVPEGGHITVRVIDQGAEVLVAVADDGPGVPTEDLSHLFDRFWRGDPARRQATGGSGLGLAIARHIVEAHNGRLWAEPTPGGGLTVAFSLPTARDENTVILVEKPRKHVEKRQNNHELQLTGNS